MKKYSILLFGGSGKMGKELQKLIQDHKFFSLYQSLSSLTNNIDPDKVDLVIDFSHKQSFSDIAQWTLSHKKVFLSGTTGLDKEDFQLLNSQALVAPVFWSANMSIGVYLLSLCAEVLSKKTKGLPFSFSLEETHHVEKKDSPSGTALSLLNIFQKHGEDIKITSRREGRELGQHKISISSLDESLVLEHQAHSRSLFAKGAIKAAEFLVNQPAGLYGMKDLFS